MAMPGPKREVRNMYTPRENDLNHNVLIGSLSHLDVNYNEKVMLIGLLQTEAFLEKSNSTTFH